MELVSVVRQPATREHTVPQQARIILRRKYGLADLPGVEVERLVWSSLSIKGKI